MGTLSKYQKTVAATTKNLSDVREFVADHAKSHGFKHQQISDIRLAVDEAVTNIIKHAYQGNESSEIRIELQFENNMLCIMLMDSGKTFNMKTYKEPDIQRQIKQKKRGGMGVYLIHSLMDEVTYSKKNGENQMVMCIKKE